MDRRKTDNLIRKYLISKLSDRGILGRIDAFCNISYKLDPAKGEVESIKRRYNIMTRVVRNEILMTKKTRNGTRQEWIAVSSQKYSDVAKVADQYFTTCTTDINL